MEWPGLVTALRFTRALSNGPDIQNEKWLRTDYSRLDIKHLLRWDLYRFSVFMELIQGVDVNFVICAARLSRQDFRRNASPKTGGKRSICEKCAISVVWEQRRQRERLKSSWFLKQNNDFAPASRFLVVSLPSLHDYGVKMPIFTFYGGRKQVTTNCSFSFVSWVRYPRNQLQGNSPTLDIFSESE